jgi:hypothetical protein
MAIIWFPGAQVLALLEDKRGCVRMRKRANQIQLVCQH